jgi:hypothetical protein
VPASKIFGPIWLNRSKTAGAAKSVDAVLITAPILKAAMEKITT